MSDEIMDNERINSEDESFESLVAGICLNARAASDLNEATKLTVQTLEDNEFWAELSIGREMVPWTTRITSTE